MCAQSLAEELVAASQRVEAARSAEAAAARLREQLSQARTAPLLVHAAAKLCDAWLPLAERDFLTR